MRPGASVAGLSWTWAVGWPNPAASPIPDAQAEQERLWAINPHIELILTGEGHVSMRVARKAGEQLLIEGDERACRVSSAGVVVGLAVATRT